MKHRGTPYITILLAVIIVLLKLASYKTDLIENYYSNGFYKAFSAVLRKIFGWFPISIGDVLYGLLGVLLLFGIGKVFKNLSVNRQQRKRLSLMQFFRGLNYILIVYLLFNVFWGLNYNRHGVAKQLNLTIKPYDAEELSAVNYLLALKVNENRAALPGGTQPLSNSQLFKKTIEGYQSAKVKFPFLNLENPSLKPSLWGWFGNYAGFTGYYNPFTGEAQVNTTVPHFLQPFIACHEAAHQLGYAKEMEANFVGYLAASSSVEPIFRYSSYLDLFLYANRDLYFVDSVKAISYRKKLTPSVIADLKLRAKFSQEHQSFLEPIVGWGYGIFLRSNEQPQGLLSYDEVTGFLIAYFKKYKKI